MLGGSAVGASALALLGGVLLWAPTSSAERAVADERSAGRSVDRESSTGAVPVAAPADIASGGPGADAAGADGAGPDDAPVGGAIDSLDDPRRWASLPALLSDELLTADDLGRALPDEAPWTEPIWDWAVDPSQAAWCDDPAVSDPPRTVDVAALPAVGTTDRWQPEGTDPPWVEVSVARWEDPAGAGVDAARAWRDAVVADATRCEDAVTIDVSALPGEGPFMTVTRTAPAEWWVRFVTSGGPTGVRLEARIGAPTAVEARARAASVITATVDRLEAADDAAVRRSQHPADRPSLSAAHFLDRSLRDDGGTPPATGSATPARASDERVRAGACAGAAPLDVPLPADAWAVSWAESDSSGYGPLAVDERVVRFTGIGDDAGLDAASRYYAALEADVAACFAAAGESGRSMTPAVASPGAPGSRPADLLVSAVDRGDGTWQLSSVSRVGVTVVAVQERVTAPTDVVDDVSLSSLDQAWHLVHAADGTPVPD